MAEDTIPKAEQTPTMKLQEPLFRELNPDDPDAEVLQIDSACMNCFSEGVSKLLLAKIPFYKDVLIMSFQCEKCGYRNSEIQSTTKVEKKGVKYVLKAQKTSDLDRRVMRSEYTCVKIPELDFEIPAGSQNGSITTVEGVIDRAIEGLQQDQPRRKQEHPQEAAQIDEFIEKLENLKSMTKPFEIILEDASGNCFIENPNAPHPDPSLEVNHFTRTKEQDHLLCIYTEEETSSEAEKRTEENKQTHTVIEPITEEEWPLEELQGEVLQFPTNCPDCNAPCITNMKVTNVPHFKDVVIMATACDTCGHKTNEVKSGSGIEDQGIRFEVQINSKDDLSRDVLKSDMCSLSIPEFDFDVGPSALGGRFTTVEGVLSAMRDQIFECGTIFHDSQNPEVKDRMDKFFEKLDSAIKAELPITVILDDPSGNSYIQALTDDGSPDDKLKVIRYERTFDQNEELGLNDMKTENYTTD